MKHICFLLLFAAATVLSAAAKPATATTTAKPAETAKSAATTSKPDVSVLTTIYRTNPDPSAFADQEKAERLINRRAELVQRIQDERKRLLKEDASA